MKKILFVLFLTVVLVAAGCSEDVEPDVDIVEAEENGEMSDEETENNEEEITEETGEEELPPPPPPPAPRISFSITSPYAGVDWSAYGQYKAALHVHSTNSDGDINLSDLIEEYYQKDYDILAVTDHDVLTVDWIKARNGLTPERFSEISSGSDREGRGILQIPYTNEQSGEEHLNTYFTDYNNPVSGATLESNIIAAHGRGGISRISHPGQYTGGKERGAEGGAASKNPETIAKYAELFMKFPSLVGLEINAAKDAESLNDRILWDNILKETVPSGRFVWGFSDDDAHKSTDIDFNYNVFVMPENNLENFKSAMYSGSFYAVARVAEAEIGNRVPGTGPVPVIRSIVVQNGDENASESEASITINAENYIAIEWISNGNIIFTGETIDLTTVSSGRLGSYVRANIIGQGGVVYTQPFGISRITETPPAAEQTTEDGQTQTEQTEDSGEDSTPPTP